jgi:hypothetical protein
MSQKIKTSVEIDGSLKASQIENATVDTDKFLVSDGGTVKYRTGAEMLSDLGVAPGVASNIQHQVKAGVAINKGQAVYVTGADGTNMIVGLASNASEATSSKTMGLLNATVLPNGFADVITEGLLSGLNTSAAVVGNPVWLGVNGNLIYGLANKPYAPNHLVFIGIVTRVNANNGEIFVKVQNGFELDELHDVDLKTTAPVGNDILVFEGAPSYLWKNKSISTVLGYTPANANGTNNYIPKFTGVSTLGNSKLYEANGTILNDPTANFWGYQINGSSITGQSFGAVVVAGTNSSDISFEVRNQAGNVSYLKVVGDGKVGIGTSSPIQKLDVFGTSRISSSTPTQEFFSTGNGDVWGSIKAEASIGTGGQLAFSTKRNGNTETVKVRITESGNTIFYPNLPVVISGQGAAYYGSNITLASDTGSTQGANRVWSRYDGTGRAALTFETATNSQSYLSDPTSLTYTEYMRISGLGNVGIGTTSPSGALHVATFGQYSYFSSNANGSSLADIQGLSIGWNRSSGAGETILAYNKGGGSTGGLVFSCNDGGTYNERMRITSGGNLLIGTTTDAGIKLYVNGGVRATDLLITNDRLWITANRPISDWISSGLTAGHSSTNSYSWLNGTSNLVLGTEGVEKMRITSAGNVGIGVTSPSFQLQLSNDSAAKPGSPLWTVSSDIRIKENIRPYTDGLEKLMQVNPVYYDYNGKAGFSITKDNVGIIAQEMQEVLPNTIKTFTAKLNEGDENETELLSFNANELIYVLINSVKELKAEIEILKQNK